MRIPSSIGVILLCAAALLWACGAKPFDYRPQTEIPEGPGVFSGKDGEFTVYDSNAASEKKDSAADSQAGARADEQTGPGAAASAAGQPEETAEYREFQQWKKDRQAFEEFRRWKQSEQGAEEYREFQQWLQWREYKKWQESQQPAR